MEYRVFLLNEDRSFQVEYTIVEAEMSAAHDLWTEDEPPQPMWTPFYRGGTVDELSRQVTGGTWEDPGAPSAQEEAETQFSIKQANLTLLIQGRLDEIARERGYDSILSLCSYATSKVPRFAAEGQAGVDIRDACWMIGYDVLGQIARGERDFPTDEEALAMMPPMEWPDVS